MTKVILRFLTNDINSQQTHIILKSYKQEEIFLKM